MINNHSQAMFRHYHNSSDYNNGRQQFNNQNRRPAQKRANQNNNRSQASNHQNCFNLNPNMANLNMRQNMNENYYVNYNQSYAQNYNNFNSNDSQMDDCWAINNCASQYSSSNQNFNFNHITNKRSTNYYSTGSYASIQQYSPSTYPTNEMFTPNQNCNANSNYSLSNEQNKFNNSLNNEKMPNLRSIRASNKNKISKNLSTVTITNLIEQCFEQLNELRKERVNLLLNHSNSKDLSLILDQLTLDGLISIAFEEYNEIGSWIKKSLKLYGNSNENFQTIDCSFQCWFNQIQSIKYLSKKAFIELDLDQIDTNSVMNSSIESGAGSVQSPVAPIDLQLYGQLQQLIKSTREVRKSLWCIAVLYSNQTE